MWIYTSNYMSCEFIPTTRCCLATFHHFVSDGSHLTNNVQVVEVTASHPTQPAEAQNWPKMEDEKVAIGDTKIWTTHQYTQQSKHIQTPFWKWDSFGVLFALDHPCPCCFDRGWASNPHTWVCKVRCSKKTIGIDHVKLKWRNPGLLPSIHLHGSETEVLPLESCSFKVLADLAASPSCKWFLYIETVATHSKQLQHKYSTYFDFVCLCNCARVCIFAP